MRFIAFFPFIAEEGKQISFNAEKAVKWLKEGAMPSDTVRMIFNRKNIKMDNPEVPSEAVTGRLPGSAI